MLRPTMVLIPAHNEAGRIGPVLAGIRRTAEATGLDLAAVVVDDGSSDGTGAEAARHGARVLRHTINLGYGAALHTGYLFALKRGFNRVVQLDADGQHDPGSIPALLDALDRGADLVVGSRYGTAKSSAQADAPRSSVMRRLGTRFFSKVVSIWTGIRIYDPTSGFQALSLRALRKLAHDGFPEDYPDADMLITSWREGLQLDEVPVVMHERLGGRSMHRGMRIAYYGYKMMLGLTLLPIRRPTPFRLRDTVSQPDDLLETKLS